jgi:peptide/nickel transport system substrate-binding protein
MTPRRHRNRATRTPPSRALAAVLVVAAACAPRGRRTPDDTLVLLIEDALSTVDPRCTRSNYDTKVSRLIAPGLVVLDTDDQRPRPELADTIVQVDDTTWDVTVRPEARFSDGAPVTAADVAWTYDTMLRPGSDSIYAREFQKRFDEVVAVDDRRVRFHLVEPLATFMTDIDAGILAAHSGQDRCTTDRVLGAGPYRLVSLDRRRVVLAANPHYHGEAPRLPRVEIRVVKDGSARIVMLVGGSADLIQNAVRPDLVDEVAARERVAVASGPSTLLTYLLMNNQDARFADPRLRQAIALALDRPAIIDAMFQGRARLATGLLAPGHWAYEPDVARWDHDPARARQLLDDAGYPDPPGAAPRLSVVLKTTTDQFRVAVARVIAAQLAAVGIDVDVRAFERGTFIEDLRRGQFQLATGQTSDIGEPDFYRTYFHSSRWPEVDPGGLNRWRYQHPRVDELVMAGRQIADLSRRKEIYAEVQQIIAAEVPIVPLWHEDNVVISHRDVTGYRILPNARFNGLVTADKHD